MYKIIALFTGMLLLQHSLYAQPGKSTAYKTGIYVYCGTELPKKFSYVIERKSPADTSWQVLTNLAAPASETEIQGALLSLPPAVAAITTVQPDQVQKIWRLQQAAQTLDSLYTFATDPRYQAAVGCGWFDEGLTKNGIYQYRITRLQNGNTLLVSESRVNFPAKSYTGFAQPVSFQPGETSIRISYSISDLINTAGVNVYRSNYLENKFSPITANVFFTREGRRMVAKVTDVSSVPGLTYSYYAIPYDALGNEGSVGDTLNVYNVKHAANIAIIQKFDATAKEESKSIELAWKLKTGMNVTSVDIFRSRNFEGVYDKITSVPATDTTYEDNYKLEPAVSFYYYLVANNGYGNNLPSARMPVILKGIKPNYFPPQHLTASKNGNIVTLRFSKMEDDTRGYYVYRANNYMGSLRQLPRMLLSTDSVLTYIDTLPLSSTPDVYSYAVADINNSYNISPLSEKLSIQTSGLLPIPTNIRTVFANGGVFVTWKDVSVSNPAVSGYNIYRSATDENGKVLASPALIATTTDNVNSIIDSTHADGFRFGYQVQSVGLNTEDLSSLSNVSSVFIPAMLPVQPGQVSALAVENAALIQWDLPEDTSVIKIRVYRALANEKPVQVSELSASETQFEDKSIDKNKTYHYMITTVNSNNRESKPTSAVSVRLRS